MPSKSLVVDAPLIGILILVFFVYCFSPYFAYWIDGAGWGDKRVLQLALMGLAGCLAMVVPRYRSVILIAFSSTQPLMRYGFSTFVLLALATCVTAAYPMRSLQELGLIAGMGLVGLCVWVELKTVGLEMLHRCMSVAFLLASLGLIGLFLSYYLVFVQDPHNLHLSAMTRWVPHFGNPRAFNHVQVWVIPLMSWCLIEHWRRSSNMLWLIGITMALSFWWSLVFFTLGRGVFWSLLFGVIATGIICYRRARFLALPVVCAVLGIMLYMLMFVAVPLLTYGDVGVSYVDRISDINDSGRFRLWALATSAVIENPILGIGGQHYAMQSNTFGSAHNMWLNWAAEQGLPSLILLVLGCIAAARKMVSIHGDDSISPLHMFLMWQFITALLYSCLTALWITPLSQVLMAGSLALCTSTFAPSRSAGIPTSGGLLLAAPLLTAVLIMAVASIVISVVDLNTMRESLAIDGLNYPRFWLNGHFFHQ